MEPLEFLAAVLPTAGVYCVAELSTNKKEHRFTGSLEDAYEAAKGFARKKKDTYFALASFMEEGSRTADNALYIRSAFMDLDCGPDKAYPNKQAAAAALDTFLQETDLALLGTPTIVSSGGGLHVYWPFTAHQTVAAWRPMAENLKRLAKLYGLAIDFTVTADSARVLRVPGTHNYKQDRARPVKLMVTGGVFDFGAFSEAVREKLNGSEFKAAPAGLAIPGKRPTPVEGTAGVKLVENRATSFRAILNRTMAGDGCLQLKHYVEHATDDGMEPLWRALLSIAKPCEDGQKAAEKMSALHPYPQARMEQKLKEIKGPYPCTKIDSENPGVCQGCPHWGKITNPLLLGVKTLTDNTEKPMEVVAPGGSTPVAVTRPVPPKGFSYGKNGGVYVDKTDEDTQGNVMTVSSMILPYDLFAQDILSVNGDHTVFMVAARPEGTCQITLPQKAVVSKDDTVKALANQNIISTYGSGNDTNLFNYVRACVEQLSTSKQSIKVPSSYGWQPDDTFVYNGMIYKGGMTTAVPMVGLENITMNTVPTGSLQAWRDVYHLMVKKELWDILAMSLVGFGAPLMRFSGLNGMTFHIGSTESGTGKTLAMELAASVWGHPTHYRVNKDTSGVAMQQRLGLLRSLPLITDEITHRSRKDPEWFPGFLLDMTEGRGKERMESGANKERINNSVWCTLSLMTSNTHAYDYLTGGRKQASEGELRRLLEQTMTSQLVWGRDDIEVIKTLQHNYGLAGHQYVSWLVQNTETAKAVYMKIHDRLVAQFSATNDERFWMAGVASLVAGMVLASSTHAGIINLPTEPIIESLRALVFNARNIVRTSFRSADDILNEYTREFHNDMVIVRQLGGELRATFGEAGLIEEGFAKSKLAGRVEHGVTPGHIDYYIEEQLLKSFCSARSFGYADFRRQLERKYFVKTVRKDMLNSTKGPEMRVTALRICQPIAGEYAETPQEKP